MIPSNGKWSLSTSTSSCAWESAEMVFDRFPASLRVLIVDDNPTCLMILKKMFKTCQYEEIALSNLRNNRNGFDIALSDVQMPDMDGFKLLEFIGLKVDLTVIMMSVDNGKHVVLKGATHGASDFLIKPRRIEALKNIWQHIVRKGKNEWKELEQSGSAEDGDRVPKHSEDIDYSSTAKEGTWKNVKRRKDDDEDGEERDDTSTLKKPRVVWLVELHQQFFATVNQLGIDSFSQENFGKTETAAVTLAHVQQEMTQPTAIHALGLLLFMSITSRKRTGESIKVDYLCRKKDCRARKEATGHELRKHMKLKTV